MDKMKSVDWRGLVRNATNKVKQYAMNLSPLEVQVEEATNMDTWGPHGKTMAEIAEACYDPEGYRQVLGVIARRLQEKEERWRMCYKALLLLEYLIKHGPKVCIHVNTVECYIVLLCVCVLWTIICRRICVCVCRKWR